MVRRSSPVEYAVYPAALCADRPSTASTAIDASTPDATAAARLGVPRIAGDRRGLAGGLVPDQQRTVGGDGNALGLAMALGIEPPACHHAPPAVHLGKGVLGPGDENVRANGRMPGQRAPVEMPRACHPLELPLGNDQPRLLIDSAGFGGDAQNHHVIPPALALDLLAEQQEGAAGLVPGHSLDRAHAFQPPTESHGFDAPAVRTLAPFVDLAAAGHQKDPFTDDLDILEITMEHAVPAGEGEPLERRAVRRIDLEDDGLLVSVSQQPAVGRKGEAREFGQTFPELDARVAGAAEIVVREGAGALSGGPPTVQ